MITASCGVTVIVLSSSAVGRVFEKPKTLLNTCRYSTLLVVDVHVSSFQDYKIEFSASQQSTLRRNGK
jgi:hypothetical protein